MSYKIVNIWDKIFQKNMRYQVDSVVSADAGDEELLSYAREIVQYINHVKGAPDTVFMFFWRDRENCGWVVADAAVVYDVHSSPSFRVDFNRLS